MRLLHMADLHIGKTVNGMNLIEDQRYVLTQVLDLLKKEPADGLLLAGDIYDRSIPPAEAVTLFNWFLTEVSELMIPIFAVAGNHDSGERLEFGQKLFGRQKVYVEGTLKKEFPAIELEDEYGTVMLHLLPYFKPAEAKAFYPEDEIRTYEEAMSAVLKRHQIDPKVRNVLVTHQFVTGTEPVEQSDSELELSVGGADQISYSLFEDYDYVALGHIHGPQRAGKDTVRYSGSILKYSFSEEFHKKSVTLIDMKQKGEIFVKVYPLVPKHNMRRIKGRLENLLNPEVIAAADSSDYISAVLTDEEELADPMEKLRASYPNIMELSIEKRQKSGDNDITADVREKTPLELGEAFLLLTSGEKEEKRMDFLKQLLEEGGMDR
ncbi:exonuclease SbcCD subunit D [Anaerostipes sp.]|uniref:exonuclease SbcCD subunit D n=1 Tax=Anaerostipes sp. TaxID=1872530 RepID=UPI0025BDB156|nr:exonuclease SbcCD subunit D [Anaerostipes sp.]MBS7007558.1 exonuclease SbcCD subunit D [Anaerostipes sp.]